MSERVAALFVAVALAASTFAVPVSMAALVPAQPPSGELALAIARLRVVGNVLYVAAHPDDENTRLLAWLVGDKGLRTAYLSLTRGDGGQNLLGTEQGELFGLLRTSELLEARQIDGAEQYFTRAVDFGYSKSTEESLRLWHGDEVLGDVVRVMRRFRPDIVIARFSAEDAKTHGHHSASARLAREAYVAAADAARFPDAGPPWKASRLLWNKSTWSKPPEEDWSRDLPTDVGGYSALLGQSWGEIAGRSRSMHRSQGFGAEQQRGSILEYFEVLEGDRPADDILAGIDFSWRRAGGDDALIRLLERASAEFRPDAPHEVLPLLLDARARIRALPDSAHKRYKQVELDRVIAACAGLWLEATSDGHARAAGEEVEVTATALSRSPFPVELLGWTISGADTAPAQDGPKPLAGNQPLVARRKVRLRSDAPDTTPPWLRAPADGAMYRLPSPDLIGTPEGEPALSVRFELRLGGETLELDRDVHFKWVDPVVGERRRPLEVHPPVTMTFDRKVLVFPAAAPRELRVLAKAGAAAATGTIRLEAPTGWRIEPAQAAFDLDEREAEQSVVFRVTPPSAAAGEATIRAVADIGGRSWSQGLVRIEYPHVPIRTLFPPAEAKAVPIDIRIGGRRIGYIPGAGDEVAQSLREVGYDVTMLDDAALAAADLSKFDAVVLGVRAHNVNRRLRHHHARLMSYVEAGGTLVVQYNAVNRISDVAGPLGPYPFEVTRDRVTDERSPVRFEIPAHAVLQTPNRIGPSDFDGWVQERGLYFASSSDPHYEAPLAMHDAGEAWDDGALLVARHGKGRYVYTGLSFFRQLPAGVPGAFRLFANLLDRDDAGSVPPVARARAPREPRADDQSGVRN